MAVEHTHTMGESKSVTSVSWLLLTILFLLLILILALVVILLNKLRSEDIVETPISVAQSIRPTQPTRIMTVAVADAPISTLPIPTVVPTYTLQLTDGFSELPILDESPTPTSPTFTPLSPTETPLPTATPLPPTETPTPIATPEIVKTGITLPIDAGWYGTYYDNMLLEGSPVLEQQNADLAFNWGYSAPVAGVPADQFSARWERILYLDAGVYQFYIYGDDGARVWVDNLLLINEWHSAMDMTYTGQVTLRSGNHNIRVEYYEDEGTAELQFWWEGPSNYSDWRGEYWPNKDFSGDSSLVRNDEAIDFNWGRNSPDDELPRDEFSARWTRLVTFEEGTYRFHAIVDDGMRLYIDNEMVVYDWGDSSTDEISATHWLSSGSHFIKVEYFENKGVALVQFWWERESSN